MWGQDAKPFYTPSFSWRQRPHCWPPLCMAPAHQGSTCPRGRLACSCTTGTSAGVSAAARLCRPCPALRATAVAAATASWQERDMRSRNGMCCQAPRSAVLLLDPPAGGRGLGGVDACVVHKPGERWVGELGTRRQVLGSRCWSGCAVSAPLQGCARLLRGAALTRTSCPGRPGTRCSRL